MIILAACASFVWGFIFWIATRGYSYSSFHSWLSSFYQWDSELYYSIWKYGYLHVGQKSLAYPPGYPYVVGWLSFITGDFHVAAMLVNFLALAGAMYFFMRLLSKQFHLEPLILCLVFLSSITNYFIFSIYSDSLFIFLIWFLFYTLMTRPKIKGFNFIEVLLFILLPWVRIASVALVGLVLNRVNKSLWLLISFGLFLFLQFYVSGDFLFFLHVQQKLFAMPAGWFEQGFSYTFGRLLEFNSPWYLQMVILPAFYFVAILVSSLWFWLRGHKNYALSMAGFLVLTHNMAFWRSSIRYDWFAMPLIFIPLLVGVKKSKKKWLYYTAIFALLSMQFYFQIIFAHDLQNSLWAF